jgi:hypothetical protein
LDLEEWFKLRNIVFDAAPPSSQRPADSSPDHPAVMLVRKYYDSGDYKLLNQAAKMVAILKPGVDADTAVKEPWLVIDKS